MKTKLLKILKLTSKMALLALIFMSLVHIAQLFVIEGEVHNDFKPLLTSFQEEAELRDFHIISLMKPSIVYKEFPKNATNLAVCRAIFGRKPTIYVNQNSWFDKSQTEQEMIIFHELAHCLLLKGHNHNHSHHNPSLMNPYLFNAKLYKMKRTMLINDTFSYRKENAKEFLITFIFSDNAPSFLK